jgi:hypothetical protein
MKLLRAVLDGEVARGCAPVAVIVLRPTRDVA